MITRARQKCKCIFIGLMLPSVHDRDDARVPIGDFHEGRLGHVEMSTRWVAPTTIIRGLGPVRRA